MMKACLFFDELSMNLNSSIHVYEFKYTLKTILLIYCTPYKLYKTKIK